MDEDKQKYLAELRAWFTQCQNYYQDEMTASLSGEELESGNHGPPPPPPTRP